MANMTVSSVRSKSGVPDPKMKSIVFTHTAAGTADGSVASTEDIHGTLLRIVTDDGGDGAWNIVLNDGIADIWTSPSLGTSAQTLPLGIEHDGTTPDADTDSPMWGIPIAGQNLTCSTSNMSGSGTGPVITVIFRQD